MKKSLFFVMGCLLTSVSWAADATFTMSSIFDGTNLSIEVTSPVEATVSTTTSKSNSKTGKLGSDGNYFQIVLKTETFSAASINGFINTGTIEGKNWAFQFSTDKGANWTAEVTQANDGNKNAHDIAVSVAIPAGANGFRVVRRAGTSTQVNSITLTIGGSATSTDATLKSIVYGTDLTPVPNFSASQLDYQVELPADYVGGAPSVQATANDSKATINYTQATTLPGTAKIDVTAEDETTKRQYTVAFTKASSAPKVESATWANIKGTATIDNVNMSITGQVTNGSSLNVEPSFTGKNISSWTPTGAQNFANGVIYYTFTSATSESTVYAVAITEAPAMSSDATLKSLMYGGSSVPNFSPSTYVYNIQLTEGIKTPPTISATANDAKANVVITQASSVPGSGKVDVTAEDGTTKLTYTINYTVQVPSSDLTLHVPEIYEAKEIAGGYDGTLRVVNGREYEVYYPGKTTDSYASVCVKPNTQKQEGITTNTSASSTKAKDGWFEASITSISNTSLTENAEFEAASTNVMHKMNSNNAYKFHVKGFDQFSILAKDKKLDTSSDQSKPTNNQLFDVYIDNVVQPRQSDVSNITIRRFDMSTAEHVIEVRAINSGNSELYGFSLRVAQEPRTKYLKGNDSTQTVLQTTAIKSVSYVTKYNNISGAETRLLWKGQEASGIDLKKIDGPLTDTLILGGTANCPVGTYEYAVVAYYNGVETSRSEGKFKVTSDIQATSDINVKVYQGEEIDQITFKYYALSADAVQLSWTGATPTGISGSGSNGKYIIGGTPQTTGDFPFEITVIGADTVIKGLIKVETLNYGDNSVLYLYKNNLSYEKDGVYDYIQNKGKWNLVTRKAKADGLRPATQYANYKWVLISEDVDANNAELLAIIREGVNLPVLNMNAFSYAYERTQETPNGWGEPDNGSLSKGGCYITVQRDDHPIFKALNKKRGDQIQVLDTITGKGLMPINITKQQTLCLATSPTRNIDDYFADGEMQTILHEIPAEQNNGKKYICFPLANSSSKELTNDGRKLIDAILDYLMNNEQTVAIPTIEITGFSIEDIKGNIDQENKTIEVLIDRKKYPDLDLKEVQPVVTVASTYTTVTPSSGESVDLSTSAVLPVKYVVSDYINRCVYNVTARAYSPEGIEEVYTVGEWVNVYDIFGRKITTTNENIYTMELPRGIYIIVTETGQTIKISR